jgi:outer membrane receptor for ferrienterochelin and colicin
MKRLMWSTLFLLILPTFASSQSDFKYIEGKVIELSEEGKEYPLIGANVYWMGTTIGTITDFDGAFKISKHEKNTRLVISYTGFKTDTIEVNGGFVEVQLDATILLDGIEVIHRRKSTEISLMKPMKVETIGERELLKAACCNLSESFETSPSIDVSFTDAVTGTRQIQMLGLAGPYSQITRENVPDIRGLSSIYGLTFIPGTWVESIQLNKGTGSVANGFESIAGQINVELRKPESAEKIYLNLYANEGGRIEGNANFAHRFENGDWSTALLLHGKNNSAKHDRNNDGFMDKPVGDQIIALNRWKYIGDHGGVAQFGVKGTYINNIGGQMDFEPNNDAHTTNNWGMNMKIQRIEGWTKVGKVFFDTPWKSYGLQISGASHKQESYFGLNNYDASQQTLYANFMYQSIFSNTNHNFRTGASFQYDNYEEILNGVTYNRNEIVPGAYLEYTMTQKENFNIVAGGRVDYHNIYGLFITPRLHLRYAPADNSVIRASAGRGQRTASIISENNGLLASSRIIEIQGDASNKPYGLDAEVAWNYGLNFTQKFVLDYRDGALSFDFYRTNFENQIVVDLDQSARKAIFYNLDGKSFSNSFQAQLDYEVINRLDMRIAYRWYDVQTTYDGELLKKPFVGSHRAFLNLGYSTRSNWNFDYTLNWQGKKRLPDTSGNPEEFQLGVESPDFAVMNFQVSKTWREKFEVYVGAENFLGYKQDDPIVSNEDPFSDFFDSSMIWGPLFGRNIYMGFRYRIK